jgi:CRP-like cAMP-binding protein
VRQLDLTERLLRLRGVPTFRNLTTTDLAPLAATVRSARFEKGEVLLHEDDAPRSFYLLVTGAVTMRRHGLKLRTITAPGGVGFLSMLARSAGGTEAVAEATTEAFEVPGDALDDLYEDHFSVLLATLRWVTERLVAENIEAEPPPYKPPEDGFDRLIGDAELGVVERIFLLRRTIAFKNANVNSIARLVRRMREIRARPSDVIWRPGDRADANVFIVKGRMQTSWKTSKGEPRVQELGPGYVVGGGEAMAGKPRWNELVALEPVVLLEGTREALVDMFEDDLEVAKTFLSLLASFLLVTWDRKAERDAKVQAP